MALSYCSNWGTLQHLTPEMSNFQQLQSDIARQVLGLCDNIDPLNTFADPFFDPDDFLLTESYAHLPFFDPDDFLLTENYAHLPYSSSPSDPLVSLSPEIFPPDDFECYQYPKRQKTFDDLYLSDFVSNGYALNSCPVPDLLPEFMFPATEVIQIPPVYSDSNVDSIKKSNGGGLSAQSVAARQRRRKITEKTQELAKLIPGGNKMNTAEMFQAAFKYVKYLQAQVGILQVMGSIQENKDQPQVEELQVLLTSPAIQEKLYSEERCLVPKGYIEILANDSDIQSSPLISKGLGRLIQLEH